MKPSKKEKDSENTLKNEKNYDSAKCEFYQESPLCLNCKSREFIALVSQTQNYCSKCDTLFELSKEDQIKINKKAIIIFKIPESINIEQARALANSFYKKQK